MKENVFNGLSENTKLNLEIQSQNRDCVATDAIYALNEIIGYIEQAKKNISNNKNNVLISDIDYLIIVINIISKSRKFSQKINRYFEKNLQSLG